MSLFKKVLFIGITLSSHLVIASPVCPNRILLSDAKFLGGEHFPTAAQIRTNLNQSIHELNGNPAWQQEDLDDATRAVSFLQRNYGSDGTITLPVLGRNVNGAACAWALDNVFYTYDPTQEVLTLTTNGLDGNVVLIPAGRDSAVTFQVALPSNCSNCSHEAELFEFGQVEVQ